MTRPPNRRGMEIGDFRTIDIEREDLNLLLEDEGGPYFPRNVVVRFRAIFEFVKIARNLLHFV